MSYQTSQQFLKLTAPEKNIIEPLLKLSMVKNENTALSPADVQALIPAVEKLGMALLIRAALSNQQLNSLCKHPCLNNIWNEKWRNCGLNPSNALGQALNPSRPIHEYKPQPTLHTFDLLKGIFIYSQYKHHLNASEEKPRTYAPAYLQFAAHLGYFPALSGLCKQEFTKKSHSQALFYASKAAELYWTPGFFLLGVITYNIANQAKSEPLYKEALLHLIMAEKLRPHSEAMINNAYQGKSVEEMLVEAGLSNLTEAKKQLASLADLSMSWVTSVLYPDASEKVTKILNSLPPITVLAVEHQEQPESGGMEQPTSQGVP